MISVDLIKLHNPIEDVVERYYELIGRGNRRTARENPSLCVYTNTQSYNDFGGGGHGGSVIDFIMHYEKLNFADACKFLSDGITDTTPAPAPRTKPTETKDNTWIKDANTKALTPALALHGLKELYPFIQDATPFQHLLGWSHYHNSLTFEMPNLSINRRTKEGKKWVATSGDKRDHIPYKIGDAPFVYLYSGMSEIIACEAMGINYIGLQMDSSIITDEIKTAMKDKTLIVIEENDNSSRKLSQRLKKQFQHIKILPIGANKDYGYDLRDFVNDNGSFELSRMMLEKLSEMLPLEEIEVTEEITTPYTGKYISNQNKVDISSLEKCVIVAKTGSGKTYHFENKPGVMILVPRVLQTDTGKGDDTDYVINKIMSEGATLTYEKFIGHYTNRFSSEFKHYIDTNRFKVVVDEAHMIQALKPGYEIIYNLDAVFMSGTIEPFFRKDLQRYKFKPEHPTTIYYTDGELPDFDNALYFADRPKPLMRNYPLNCVVGADHNFKNFNVHQHTHGKVFTTSALREGISINTNTFDACIVDAALCSLWSVKDAIQALNRPRGDNVTRVITKPVKQPEELFADIEYFYDLAQKMTDTQEINTVMGEEYSNFIKKTHKGSRYLAATEFGVVCYLAEKTRNKYDEDLYKFEKWEPAATFEINTDTDKTPENIIMLQHTINDEVYEYPSNKREPFMRWARHKESGLVDKLVKLTEARSLHAIYRRGRATRDIKTKYNEMFNRGKNPRKYTIKKFYDLMRTVVEIDMSCGGEKIERISKHTDINKVTVSVISECPIEGVNLVLRHSLYKVIALNCSANPVHSAKTANETGRPIFDTKSAPEKIENVEENTINCRNDDRYKIENEKFLDELSEL